MKAAVSSLRSWRDHSPKQQSFGRGATKLAANGVSPPEIFSHARAKQFRQLQYAKIEPQNTFNSISMYLIVLHKK